jgi:aromatic ring-cleaving dioxygenase
MSGGHFDYAQWRINDIARTIREDINCKEDVYVQSLDKKTIEVFKEAYDILLIAAEYAQRVDWVMSGDDGEDCFFERIDENIEEQIKPMLMSEKYKKLIDIFKQGTE